MLVNGLISRYHTMSIVFFYNVPYYRAFTSNTEACKWFGNPLSLYLVAQQNG